MGGGAGRKFTSGNDENETRRQLNFIIFVRLLSFISVIEG